MNYEITATVDFERNLKRLSKKYFSLSDDYENFLKELLKNPKIGDDLGDNTRKVRMAIASKNKGKSGGARVITYNFWVNEANSKIYLLTIYDKGEQSSISKKEIRELKQANGLI
ncbi:MAG: type II toxin-antitoxin system RelE/ParE family toxin [Dysgonamonadaceae bacterium]|jgi:mRNA-degrading endonuclease RelE of RelBE toxin-antitoxin system|nr:type II toxin-antitoxin system RelE/ParE family toxin [Dysgonamonadaceae bacterium]